MYQELGGIFTPPSVELAAGFAPHESGGEKFALDFDLVIDRTHQARSKQRQQHVSILVKEHKPMKTIEYSQRSVTDSLGPCHFLGHATCGEATGSDRDGG
jgi:hypothetical protein